MVHDIRRASATTAQLSPCDRWLRSALDYIPRWIDWQMRLHRQPGCVIAINHGGRLVLEQAFGHADLDRKQSLTPQHRFRVASHSKSFTAAGILLLREQRLLTLDQPVGDFVADLHPDVARVSLSQLLSHSAGASHTPVLRAGTAWAPSRAHWRAGTGLGTRVDSRATSPGPWSYPSNICRFRC